MHYYKRWKQEPAHAAARAHNLIRHFTKNKIKKKTVDISFVHNSFDGLCDE